MEKLLLKWSDHAEIYSILHSTASNSFRKKEIAYKVPSIIITTISASLAFSIQAFPKEVDIYVPVLVGVLNLIASTFTAISSFKKIHLLADEHFTTSVKYSKLYRKIIEKLIIYKNIPKDFITEIRTQFDELTEKGPIIPNHIIRLFKKENKEIISNYNLPNIVKLGGLTIDEDDNENDFDTRYSKRIDSICKGHHIHPTSLIDPDHKENKLTRYKSHASLVMDSFKQTVQDSKQDSKQTVQDIINDIENPLIEKKK